MLPLHTAKVSVFNYDEIPPGYYHRVMLAGGPVQRFWHREKFLAIARRVGERDRVLDLGCGPGSFLSVLAEAKPGVRAIGVDIASRQIEYARTEVAAKFLDGRIEFRALGPGFGVPDFPDGAFDVVTCIEVIEHIHPYYAIRMLTEAKRVLKPGGKFLITTPNYRSLWPLIEKALERLSPVKYHAQHINQYTPNALVKFLESAGLEVADLRTIFILAPFLAGLSPQLAHRVHRFEQRLPLRGGSLLVAEARLASFD